MAISGIANIEGSPVRRPAQVIMGVDVDQNFFPDSGILPNQIGLVMVFHQEGRGQGIDSEAYSTSSYLRGSILGEVP